MGFSSTLRLAARSGIAAVFTALLLLFAPAQCLADGGESVLGFKFDISAKETKKAAKAEGLEMIEEEKDKDGRKNIVFRGSFNAVSVPGKNTKTKVSFFKNRIETVAVITEGADASSARELEDFISGKYGAPDADEKVFSYTVKSWELEDSRLTISHSGGGVLKLAQTDTRTRKKRRERDIARDKRKDRRHPVQKMIDGDFSKPEYR